MSSEPPVPVRAVVLRSGDGTRLLGVRKSGTVRFAPLLRQHVLPTLRAAHLQELYAAPVEPAGEGLRVSLADGDVQLTAVGSRP